MDRRREDEFRLLHSSRTSEDDLEAFEAPDVNHPSPYVSTGNSTDVSPRSSLPDYNGEVDMCAISCQDLSKYSFHHQTRLSRPKGEHDHTKLEAKVAEMGKAGRYQDNGRSIYVNLLDCYLKRNLVVNGGFLDEVHWMADTKNEQDLKYLDGLVNATEPYKQFSIGDSGYADIWALAKENNTLYTKIDDDILYIHDDAIPRLVQTRIRYPEAFDIAANIINSPLTNWFHHRTEAVHPYLPETKPSDALKATDRKASWRPSELPLYSEDAPDEFDFGEKMEGQEHFDVGQVGGPPSKGYRWLPLSSSSANLLKTPIAHSEYGPWSRGWTSWAIGAQQQYSLFDNLEANQVERYWFGNEDGIWNMQYDRYNLNFLAIWGRDASLEIPT
ncbi:hypothetical protein MMC30_006796 [Trapelia coarctata]|nr:hypothetical protein [Trapelia coarctata]